MDLKFWIWLLIIGISLIARLVKKQATDQKQGRAPEPLPPSASRREHSPAAVTFEELLKEMQGSKHIESPASIPAHDLTKYDLEDYDDDAIRKKKPKPLEDTAYDYRKHDTIYKTYDDAKLHAFERPSLEETMKLDNTVVRFNAFKSYQKESTPSFAATFARDIRNPAGFKKAFIMNEILQRRF